MDCATSECGTGVVWKCWSEGVSVQDGCVGQCVVGTTVESGRVSGSVVVRDVVVMVVYSTVLANAVGGLVSKLLRIDVM